MSQSPRLERFPLGYLGLVLLSIGSVFLMLAGRPSVGRADPGLPPAAVSQAIGSTTVAAGVTAIAARSWIAWRNRTPSGGAPTTDTAPRGAATTSSDREPS